MKMNLRIAAAILTFVCFVAAAPVPDEQSTGVISDTITGYIKHNFAQAMIEHQPKLEKDVRKCGLKEKCIRGVMEKYGAQVDEQAIYNTVSQLHLTMEDGAAAPNVTAFQEKFKPVTKALNDRLEDRASKCPRSANGPKCVWNSPKKLAAEIEKETQVISHGLKSE
ncbi:hypothetical protein BDZ45DRAFT_792778 [Acephala macrosclerotiorum]|nr:hypothetical protein BDZ45DRAFT_792778 [Acephala macrosclerotiorum]